MGSLLKQKFWLVGVPQLISALMIGGSIWLYSNNYKQHAFIILIMTAIWSNVWWGFFYNRLVTSPIRKLLHTFSKGLVSIPELQGNLVARNDLSTISADLEAVFRYLDESLTLYKQAINSAAEAILTIDEFGIIQSFNNSATRIFGYEPEEVLGKNISMLMPSPHR